MRTCEISIALIATTSSYVPMFASQNASNATCSSMRMAALVGSNASGSGATMQECERNGEAARKAW